MRALAAQLPKMVCVVKGCRNAAERLPNGLTVCFRHRTGRIVLTRPDGNKLLIVDGKVREEWSPTRS